MRVLVVMVLSVALLAGALSAEEGDSYYTDNHINGRFWKTLKFPDKLYYLYGMIDGISVISEAKSVFDEAHNIKPDVSAMILKSTGRFFIPKGTYKEIIAYIDGFYEKESNLDISVFGAYTTFIADKKEWDTLSAWDDALKGLRGEAQE